MTFVEFLFAFSTSLFFFMAIDLLWLGVVAKDFYKKQLKQRMAKQPNWPAAVLFYFIFIGGLHYFAISEAIVNEEFLRGILDGFMYGIFTYTTYELTNLAVLKNWPKKLVPIDILWGGVLCASVTALTYITFFII